MPELPEVEIVRRGLHHLVASAGPLEIRELTFFRPDLRWPFPVKALRKLCGASLVGVERRAKFLIFETTAGKFISHLGMTGSWRQEATGFERRTHDHFAMGLSNGFELVYQDARRFGFIIMEESKRWQQQRADLGPEPLGEALTGEYLYGLSRGRKTPIKTFIMNQKIVVGVGNIYASEALHLARLRPTRLAGRVRLEQFSALATQIRNVLESSLAAGGSSISDFRHVDEVSGYFQNQFRVYDRAGLPCLVCGTKIKSKRLAGRSSFWCENCQK